MKKQTYPIKHPDGRTRNMTLQFAQYQNNDATALILNEIHPENAIYASVNITSANLPNKDYIIIDDRHGQHEIRPQLIALGLIEEEIFGYAPSGYIVTTISKLTPKAIAIRDAE